MGEDQFHPAVNSDGFLHYMPRGFVQLKNGVLGHVYVPINGCKMPLGVDYTMRFRGEATEAQRFFHQSIWFEEDAEQFDVWDRNIRNIESIGGHRVEFFLATDDYFGRILDLFSRSHQQTVDRLGYGGQNKYRTEIAPYRKIFEEMLKTYGGEDRFHELVPHFNDIASLGDKLEGMRIRLADRKGEREKERQIERSKERFALIAALEAILPLARELRNSSEAYLKRLSALLETLRAGKLNEMMRLEARRLAVIWNRDESRSRLVLPNQATPKQRGRPSLPVSAKIRKPPGDPKLKPHIQSSA
jgi:hypothetical protein